MKTQLIIPAAGMGTRLGCALPKALVPLGGQPILALALKRLSPMRWQNPVIVVAPAAHLGLFEEALRDLALPRPVLLIEGGERRQDSVWNALQALEPDTEIVAIHDAARPFVPLRSVEASIDAAARYGAATVAVPSVDTILQVDREDFLEHTPDRAFLWACQTPQTFQVAVIREAHRMARSQQFDGTDDATLVRRCGGRVKLVPGGAENFKITTPFDLRVAEWMMREQGIPCG